MNKQQILDSINNCDDVHKMKELIDYLLGEQLNIREDVGYEECMSLLAMASTKHATLTAKYYEELLRWIEETPE